MDQTPPTAAVRREAYRITSLALLIINLLLLLAMAALLPFLSARVMGIYKDMGRSLPLLTQTVISLNPIMVFASAVLMAMILIVKEVWAPPKLRLWLNLVNLVMLLLFGLVYVAAIFLPVMEMVQAVQGQS